MAVEAKIVTDIKAQILLDRVGHRNSNYSFGRPVQAMELQTSTEAEVAQEATLIPLEATMVAAIKADKVTKL